MKGLLFIMNTDNSLDDSFLESASAAIRGGADAIQWRHKGIYNRSWMSFGLELAHLCKSNRIPLLVNDRVDIAQAIGANGVHLGQTDLPIPAARKILGSGKIIGGTASTLEEAKHVERDGADYVSFGHIYETKSKLKTSPPIGTTILRHAVAEIKIPIFAIGGINAQNIGEVWKTGIDGVAVIAAIAQAADPRFETQKLKKLLCR